MMYVDHYIQIQVLTIVILSSTITDYNHNDANEHSNLGHLVI